MEATGWTYDELMDQPADMLDELAIKFSARNKEERRQAEEASRKAKR